MAMMRTGRLTSATTTPMKTQNTKSVTVTNTKPRSFTPVAELEAQDAAYTRYQQDSSAHVEKMKRYNELTKNSSGGRDYRPFFGSESNTRRLTTTEAAEFNASKKKSQSEYLHNPGDLYIEEKNINVPKGAYKGVSGPGGKEYTGNTKAWMSDYVKPTAPTKVDKADWSNVQLDMLQPKKAVITPSAKLKTKRPTPAEKPTFEAPSRNVSKMDTKAAKTGGGKSGLVRAKGQGDLGAAKAGVIKTKTPAGYNREEKLFKAYAGTSVLNESHIGKTKSELKDYKSEMKSQNKAYRREGNIEGSAATRMEINQARQAAKYVDRASKGKNTFFNDSNYRAAKGENARIAVDYKNSADNAANRNTMESKLKAISAKPVNKTNMY